MNKASGTYETPWNRPIYALWVLQKVKREKTRKLSQRNNGWKLPRSLKGNGHPDTRSPKETNQIKAKKSTPRYIIIKLSKVQVKQNFESGKRKANCNIRFFSTNLAHQKGVWWYIQSAKIKKTTQLPTNYIYL